MNITELGEYLALKKEIELKREEVQSVKCDILACIDTSERILVRGDVSRQERRLLQLERLAGELIRDIEKCEERRKRIEEYIAAIPDSRTRSVFVLRFLRGMSWRMIALRLGGGNTSDSAKKICYRYLKKAGGNGSHR